MLTSTVPCRMCENPREETIVVYKGPREMSEDTQKEGKKEKKRVKAFKLYMLEFSLNQKVLQKNISPLL